MRLRLVTLMCKGSPSRIRQTSCSVASRSNSARSVRILTRWRVGSPCAVMPKGSLSASPIRFFPRSSARIRPFRGFAFVDTICPIIVIGGVYTESTSAERTYRVAITILATAGGVALLYYGQVFFITVIIAFMIAFLLEPGVRLLMKIRMPRGLASFLVCALWLGCTGVFGDVAAGHNFDRCMMCCSLTRRRLNLPHLHFYVDNASNLTPRLQNGVPDVKKAQGDFKKLKEYYEELRVPCISS